MEAIFNNRFDRKRSANKNLASHYRAAISKDELGELGELRLDVAEFVEICRAIDVDPCALIRRAEDR